MKCELLSEQNLALLLDFVDDENTKYDEAVLKDFLNDKNAYGYIAIHDGKAIGFAHGYGTELVRFIHEHSKTLGCPKMFLLTYKHNVSACRCYEKAGGICNAASDDIVFSFS
ncbi:MAG: GNAT family N-acetyltransferase [Lachnospiraceae bacterium]|nr:GNAT family N-acetyltransferase [Lachnospiraceae bacterium]